MDFNLMTSLLLTLRYLLIFWVIPVVSILALTYISRSSEKALGSTIIGPKSEIYFGYLGVIVHELSHMIMCIIFNHRIVSFKLLVMPWNLDEQTQSPSLGYVNHSYATNSAYQSLGNAFIGTAPIYGCTAALYFIYKYLTPNFYNLLRKSIENLLNNPSSFSISSVIYFFQEWISLFNLDFKTIGVSIVVFYLVVNITLTGFDLSTKDLQGSYKAAKALLIIMAIIFFGISILKLNFLIDNLLLKVAMWILAMLLLSLLNSLAINLLSRIVHFYLS